MMWAGCTSHLTPKTGAHLTVRATPILKSTLKTSWHCALWLVLDSKCNIFKHRLLSPRCGHQSTNTWIDDVIWRCLLTMNQWQTLWALTVLVWDIASVLFKHRWDYSCESESVTFIPVNSPGLLSKCRQSCSVSHRRSSTADWLQMSAILPKNVPSFSSPKSPGELRYGDREGHSIWFTSFS